MIFFNAVLNMGVNLLCLTEREIITRKKQNKKEKDRNDLLCMFFLGFRSEVIPGAGTKVACFAALRSGHPRGLKGTAVQQSWMI